MYNYTSSSINLQQSAEKNAFDVECARIHECREKAGTIPLSAGGVGYIFYCMSGGGELCESACFPLQSGEICLFIAGGKARPGSTASRAQKSASFRSKSSPQRMLAGYCRSLRPFALPKATCPAIFK